jgi:hypothetical protein
MARVDRLEIAKVVVAPAIALFVAVVGWVLTTRYNATQLEVAKERGAAEIEIAQTNAAMRYMELMLSIPEEHAIQRRQTIAIAAPVLPPDLGFQLAIDQLPDDPSALDILMPKYGSEAFTYLARQLEVPFDHIKRALDPVPSAGPFAVQPTELEGRAIALLHYLRERNYSERLFSYLTSMIYTNDSFRPIALLLYFHEYRTSLKDDSGYVVQQAYERVRVEDEFRTHMRMESLSPHAKQSIAFAGSAVFGQKYERQSDIFIREAASRFWENVDVARGVTPVEGSLQGYLYERVFHYNDPPGTDQWYRRDAIELSSASLRDAIGGLKFGQLDIENIRLILYAYAASPTVAGDPAYLVPADVVEVMRVILNWANTAEKRKQLSMELGSLSGHHLFLSMLPGSQSRLAAVEPDQNHSRCESAKAFAEMLLNWYAKHHAPDWFIPKFFHEVLNEFPDLENHVNREAWGLGDAWSLESSRGCRE